MTALAEQPLLPEFVYGDVGDVRHEGFRIDDDGKAAWAARKIIAARRRIAKRVARSDEYQTRVIQWLARANENDQRSIDFLESFLRPWVELSVAELGKSRSVDLLGARVGLRKKPDRVDVSNVDQVTAFCEEHQLEGVIIVKKELSKTELKRHLVEGAQIPGAALVEGSDELVVSEN
jgi:phage host-nuclease inhibitor protein Gam